MLNRAVILLFSLLLTSTASAARHAMPVGQRLENLRGNRKIDMKFVQSLSKMSGPLVHKKKRTYLARAIRAQDISVSPIAGYGIESRYDRLMSQFQRRRLKILEAGIRHGRGTILIHLATSQDRDDLVDILYRSQSLVEVARLSAPRSATRFAKLR